MEKSKLTTDIFDGQEHYRFIDIYLSDYNTAFPLLHRCFSVQCLNKVEIY